MILQALQSPQSFGRNGQTLITFSIVMETQVETETAICWLRLGEGRLRRDRVVVVVGDVLTADYDRVKPTCGATRAAADAGHPAARRVVLAAAYGRVEAAGCIVRATADAGVTAASEVSQAAADAVIYAARAVGAAAADAGVLAAGGVELAAANAGKVAGGSVAVAAGDTRPKAIDCVQFTCYKAAERGLSEPITAPDDQVV